MIAFLERVITLVNVNGYHVGDFFGVPPTGRNFNYEAMHMFRILDNKIVEHRAIRDDLSFMMQLDLVRLHPKSMNIFFKLGRVTRTGREMS